MSRKKGYFSCFLAELCRSRGEGKKWNKRAGKEEKPRNGFLLNNRYIRAAGKFQTFFQKFLYMGKKIETAVEVTL